MSIITRNGKTAPVSVPHIQTLTIPVVTAPITTQLAGSESTQAPTPTVSSGDQSGNVLTLLPSRWRRTIYVVYGLLALAGTGVSAYYGAVPTLTVPDWIRGLLAVLGALAAPISVLAATNVRSEQSAD